MSLSSRGTTWSKMSFLHGKPNAYDPIHNPGGLVVLDNAENKFLHKDLIAFFNEHNHFEEKLCAYGEGYTGTLRLRKAMANHLNTYFRPFRSIDSEEITFTAGVTDLNEVCALITCNPGGDDLIMLGKPVYGTFQKDLCLRTGVELEWVEVGDVNQFTPNCIGGYEAGFESAKARGKNVRALIIVNPHNPLGRCYPPETLVALLKFCARKGIHLISDEIYAMSTYPREGHETERFTSIRAVDCAGIIDPRQVHLLYGMSKDYGAAGLRLGCIITQNVEFSNATRAICRFSSPSQFSMDLAAKFLEDKSFVAQFLQKSHRSLLRARLLVESLLDEAGIAYHKNGNAGLFLWLDLYPYLPLDNAHDEWAAEKILSQRITQAGVVIDSGEQYHSSRPGQYRLMFVVEEAIIREGITRLSSVIRRS